MGIAANSNRRSRDQGPETLDIPDACSFEYGMTGGLPGREHRVIYQYPLLTTGYAPDRQNIHGTHPL